MKTILTIAGFDPSSGAGITADLAVFAAHRCFGTAAITALTVQSTLGVKAVMPLPGSFLSDTLDELLDDLPPAAVKIGMLATAEQVLAVVKFLDKLQGSGHLLPVVVDPVIRSTSGRELLDAGGLDLLQKELLPLATWITPNTSELALLARRPATTAAEAEAGAAVLIERYPHLNVVVTGGNVHGSAADDLVVSANGLSAWLQGERIDSRSTHGTGCAFASALACGLAQGLPGLQAARQAKAFVAQAIRTASPLGAGQGPMNLLWPR